MATPEIVLGASLLDALHQFHSVFPLGFGTILIAHIMFCISYVVVTVKARLIGFDRNLEEAAMDLGANEWATFRKVTLPLIAPAILAGALLSFALSIDDFVITYFNSGSEITFPLFVWGAARVGAPPQVNVMGTMIFVVALSLMLANVLLAAAPREPGEGMSTEIAATQIDRERVKELTERESKRLDEQTQGSKRMFERARKVLPGGVPSSYQVREPWPIYLERGEGASVWDADGRHLWDFHNGFGSMPQGHAHPAIVQGSRGARPARARHFAAPTEDGIEVAEELARRFGLPKWRYNNSGSEATMDAIRIARGLTGRDTILKIFGSYHGHHDGVMVAVGDVDTERRPGRHPFDDRTARACRRRSPT